jgi:hypothetical protein
LEQDRPELVAKRQAAIKALLAEFAAGSASTPHTGRPAIRPETVPPTVVRPTDGDRQDDARRRMHGRSQVAQVVARLRRRECHRQPIEVQLVSTIDPHGAGIAIRSPIG